MYDIEVDNDGSYAVIGEGTIAYEFLKSMNTKLTMKKLASEPGEEVSLTRAEMVSINPRLKDTDYKRLKDVGLIKHPKGSFFLDYDKFTFTEFGLEIVRDIKAQGGDIEIRL